MKAASPELIAYLNTRKSFITADLYMITPVGGVPVYYTDVDYDIEFEGNTYISGDLIFERGGTRIVIGSEVDNLDLTITAKPGSILSGSSWLDAVKMGGLDGAAVMVRKLFMPDFGDVSLGAITVFSGTVGDAKSGRMSANFSINSDLQFMNTQMPRELYQPGCKNPLFGTACKLNKATFAVAGVVTAATEIYITTNLTSATDGDFDLGTIRFTSGLNDGVTRSIRRFDTLVAVLSVPLITPPDVGDTFYIYPGCDHTKARCEGRFNNLINFRGEPYVPVPETAT